MFLMFAVFLRTTFASSKIMANLKKLNQPYGEADYIRFDKLMSGILNSFKANSNSTITPQEKLMFRLANIYIYSSTDLVYSPFNSTFFFEELIIIKKKKGEPIHLWGSFIPSDVFTSC